MLAASPLKSEKHEREREMQGLSMEEEKTEFGDENLMDTIDFDDLDLLGDVLPHLEMDHPFFTEFSTSESETKLESDNNSPSVEENGADSLSGPIQEPEPESEPVEKRECDASKKSPVHSKNQPGKKKAKVDWTPELHRRFVEAVEELGIDKAVPSRILEIMGINCLTRHNIASHLQKYRSHRKHVQAREAEAASWNRRRQIYGAAAEVNPWIAPTLGFPPATPMPHFRPLHVWGHPSVDQSVMYSWPKQLAPPPPQPHAWPAPPLADPSFWHPNHQYVPPPGTLFFPPPQIYPTRFPRPTATAIPAVVQKLSLPPSDFRPSKESIDAAIGDVLTKPWLPLPLGLKAPSMDVVMVELQRQGVSKLPPT